MSDERVEDVLAEMREGVRSHEELGPMVVRLSVALSRERAEVLKVAEEVEGIRALYGELVPFDPNIGGFDVALQRDGQRKAVCRMMNAILNGEWAAALRRAVGKKEGEGE